MKINASAGGKGRDLRDYCYKLTMTASRHDKSVDALEGELFSRIYRALPDGKGYELIKFLRKLQREKKNKKKVPLS